MKIEVYFNGKKFFGNAAYINGWNGYEASEDHGTLCALIKDSGGVPSCWDERGFPNALTDKGGRIIRIPSRGGQHITVDGSVWIGIDCIELNKNNENFVRLVEQNQTIKWKQSMLTM